MSHRVVLELGAKRAFASALEWPGWSRGGKSPEEALDRLVEYAPRFASVARRAKLPFETPSSAEDLDVVERLPGNATTDFGVPGAIAAEEHDPDPEGLDRLVALQRAAWATFDASARRAEGRTLSVGPRGGGRTLEKIIDHVRDADRGYLRQLGSRGPEDADEDPQERLGRLRTAFVDAVRAATLGEELENPARTRTPWPPRYAVRRSAWHALDHAWELEDRLR